MSETETPEEEAVQKERSSILNLQDLKLEENGKSFVDSLTIYPIFSAICSYLEILEIISLKLTTKNWSKELAAHLKERWNINRRLSRFVDNLLEFRSQMGVHNALISGSFALQFFAEVRWKESG